jgi:hypothetical protein
MTELDYTIVVPSRKRTRNMPLIRSLLPSALICVDEREHDAYAQLVPKDKLLLHPPMDGLFAIYNWLLTTIKTEIFIEIDDDFRGVDCLVGSGRRIMDPEEILAILENSARCTKDLGLTAFCYSRTQNTALTRPAEKPIRPVQPVCNAFGVMGNARYRKYNLAFLGRGDVDWTLQTLLEDRCVYADVRFYFDCGNVFAGAGGNVGLVTPEQFEATSRGLRHKWGSHVSYKMQNWVKSRQVAPISIKVSRSNKTAQK